MTAWLDMIQLELRNMDPARLIEPDGKVTSRDRVVGEMDDDLKKLYSLVLQQEKAALEIALAGRYGDMNQREESKLQSYRMRKKAEVLMENFWIELREAFGLWEKPSVGVRKGWKVVYFEPTVLDILGL